MKGMAVWSTNMHFLSFLAATLVAGLVSTAWAEEPRHITVTGSGEVQVIPDVATIRAGVETRSETALDALTSNAAEMQAVFDALAAQGIEATDIQTSQLNLNQIYDTRPTETGEPPAVLGYQASNVVTVRVHDLGQLGTIIDALGTAGANRLDGITFGIAEPRPHLDDARRAAVADARSKAELLVEAAGVTLGSVMSIDETGGRGGPVPMQARAEMAFDMPIAEGSLALTATVEIVYAVE